MFTGLPALNVVPQSQQTLVEGAGLGVVEVLGAAAVVAMAVVAVVAVVHLGLKRLALATGHAPTVTTYVLPASKAVCASIDCVQNMHFCLQSRPLVAFCPHHHARL
jgi:hypothetical protein